MTEFIREIEEIENWFKTKDYIGNKIACGRATIEEYADVIAEMDVKAARLNELKKMMKEEA